MKVNLDEYIYQLVENSTPQAPAWNKEIMLGKRKGDWNYIDGCMINSLIQLYYICGDVKYLNFADKFIDFYTQDDGTIPTYKTEDFNLDNVCEGRVLFDLFALSGKEKYQKAIHFIAKQLQNQPRTNSGNFWHKKVYPNQIWLDGLYMAQVFAARYAKAYNQGDYSDVIGQFCAVDRLMYDNDKKLFKHAIDCSKQAFWCDEKGLSKSFWLRSMGWFIVGLIDVIDVIGLEQAQQLCDIFRKAIDGILHYMHEGMFFQVVDKGGAEGNYLESSGSAMIAYALLKGARLGVLDGHCAAKGRFVFDSICEKFLSRDQLGQFHLDNICLSAGLGPDTNRKRDGSYEYYINEKVVSDDAKGVAPLIMAYTEIIRK